MNDKSIWKTAGEFNKFITLQSHTILSKVCSMCCHKHISQLQDHVLGLAEFYYTTEPLEPNTNDIKNSNSALLFSAYT
jgi:hypothetical protein